MFQNKAVACVENNTDKVEFDALRYTQIATQCLQDERALINFEFCEEQADNLKDYCIEQMYTAESFCKEKAKTSEERDKCEEVAEAVEDRCEEEQYNAAIDSCRQNQVKDVAICMEEQDSE